MSIRALLWDFGDTLCDETFMQAPLEGYPDWPQMWRQVLAGSALANDWDLGRLDMVAVSEVLGGEISAPPSLVLSHILACCRTITFFDIVMNFARATALPQAIVTVNPDVFSFIIAPHYHLAATFPVLVTSWEEKTLSKVDMGDKALALLGDKVPRNEALLIDNKAHNTDDWSVAGGQSYLFTDEQAFERDMAHLLNR